MDIRSLIKQAKKVYKKTSDYVKNLKAHKFVTTHKIIISCIAALTVMAMLMSVVLIRKNDVKIYIDGVKTSSFSTLSNNTDEWLEAAGISLDECDSIKTEGCNVYIERAFYVTLSVDGEMTSFKTTSCTVAQVIEKAEVTLSDSDIVSPMKETLLYGPSLIEISRVTTDTVTDTKTIKYTTKEVKTNSLYKGETEVVTKGENGKKEYVYKITYTDGEETERVLISETVVKEAVDKVVKVGTKEKPTVTTSSTPTSYKKVLTMRATAYTYGDDGGNKTSTGIRPYKGVVAVDPDVIPLGTKLYIETADGSYVYGTAIAADTGGSIKGNKIDVFLNSESECNKFGRRTVNVYII